MMMIRNAVYILLLTAVFALSTSHGAMFAIDPVPGATLLLPYFEVDLDDPEAGVNTTFAIRNALADAAVAHVVIYTDYSVGTLFFDVPLTGYDMETFDLREIFLGNVVHLAEDTPNADPAPPSTTNALFQSGFETGTLSEWDSFVSRPTAQGLQAWHRGATNVREATCAGRDHGDAVLRGFVVIDEANESGAGFPGEAGYFEDGGVGLIGNTNRLWGEFEIRDPADNYAFANALISIEADDGAVGNGDYTFYSRYVNAAAVDNREPLGETWGLRFLSGGAFTGGTDIIYWRDPKAVQGPLGCGVEPPWYPLPHEQLVVFDEQENPEEVVDLSSFPLACGRVTVGSASLPTSFSFGWIFINFGFDNAQTFLFPATNQGVVLMDAKIAGRMEMGMMGIPFSIAGQ